MTAIKTGGIEADQALAKVTLGSMAMYGTYQYTLGGRLTGPGPFRLKDKEALAILKFLDNKAGFKIFEIDLPDPYNKTINVYCPEWNHTYKFYNT